jgi:hypothetical protein
MSLLDELDRWEIDGEELSIFDWIAATGILSKAQWELETEVDVSAEIFVDRGDPAAWDYTIGDFTADAAWHEKSLAAKITDADATRVLLYVQIRDTVAGQTIYLRNADNSNAYNAAQGHTQVSGVYSDLNCEVVLSSTQAIEYNIAAGMDICNMMVRGWWKPTG